MNGELIMTLMTTRCVPHSRFDAQAQIVNWLLRHDEERYKDAEEGVRDAAADLWHCEDGY